MAKKPSGEPRLKAIIRKYIIGLGNLKTERHDPKFEFAFEFTSPKGTLPNGNPKGLVFNIFKPKKEAFIEIGSKVNISPEHIKILEADPKKKIELFNRITKLFLLKNVTYMINYKSNSFVILRRFHFDNRNNIYNFGKLMLLFEIISYFYSLPFISLTSIFILNSSKHLLH